MLTRETVSTWDSKRVEGEMRDRLDELKAIKTRSGGTFANASGEDAGTVRRIHGELAMLGDRLDAARATEGVAGDFAAYEDYVGKLDDYFNKTDRRRATPGTAARTAPAAKRSSRSPPCGTR